MKFNDGPENKRHCDFETDGNNLKSFTQENKSDEKKHDMAGGEKCVSLLTTGRGLDSETCAACQVTNRTIAKQIPSDKAIISILAGTLGTVQKGE